MSKKITRFLCVTLLVLIVPVAYSCKKNNVKKIEVNNSFALSLLQDDVSINEMLNIMDSTTTAWIKVLPDNTVSAIFYDTLCDIISGSKLLDSVEDIHIQQSNDLEIPDIVIPSEIQQIWASDPSYVYEFQQQFDFDNIFEAGFAIEQFEINSVVIDEGVMAFQLAADPEFPDNVHVQTVTLRTAEIQYDNGQGFTTSFANHGNVEIDLAGMVIAPENGKIIFSGSLNVRVSIDKDAYEEMGGHVGGNVHVEVSGAFTDMQIRSIDGMMAEITQPYKDTIDVKFGVKGLGGDLNLYRPTLNISYINTFAIGANTSIDTLGFYYDNEYNTGFTSLLKDGFDTDIDANINAFTPLEDNLSDHVVDYINMIEHYDGLLWNGKVSMGGQGAENLSRDSHIDLAAEAVVPFEFKINEMEYTDTLNFKVDAGNVQKFINGIEFKFRIDNGLPLKVTLQTYLMKEGAVIDSLLAPGYNVIKPSYDGEYEFCEIISPVVGDRLDNVLSADHLLLNMSVSTENNTVRIKSTNSVKIGIGLRTSTSEIDFDDVL